MPLDFTVVLGIPAALVGMPGLRATTLTHVELQPQEHQMGTKSETAHNATNCCSSPHMRQLCKKNIDYTESDHPIFIFTLYLTILPMGVALCGQVWPSVSWWTGLAEDGPVQYCRHTFPRCSTIFLVVHTARYRGIDTRIALFISLKRQLVMG